MNKSGPVFLHLMLECQRVNETEMYSGLSKRELFAALAMAGFCAHRGDTTLAPRFIAELSCECADALLAALKGEER